MLKGKIQKVELEEIGYFSGVIKITSSNGEMDKIIVGTTSNTSNILSVRIRDNDINSYRLAGENLSNRVEKITGALAGGFFKLDKLGVLLFDSKEECNDVYFEGDGIKYIIQIGEFKISVIINQDSIPNKKLSFNITETA